MDTNATLDELLPTAPSAPSLDDGELEELSPTEILGELENTALTDARRQRLICVAQGVHFEPAQVARLQSLLRRYVDAYHDPRNRDEEVAVASAIRKYIATLPVAELLTCQDWLTVERRMPAPLEMEVAKMITRKLAATLPEETNCLAPIGEQLIDLVRSYLNPRVLSKRFFGTTVVEASLALALLRSPHLAEASTLLGSGGTDVVRFIVARQAKALSAEIETRFPGERSEAVRHALACLVAAAQEARI